MKYSSYSVLMSVYHKEKPEFLIQSMDSIYNQTIKTNDFVLICDGPLNEELDKAIELEKEKFGDILNVVRLPENKGLGNALRVGVEICKNELIARMDSDDISKRDRCEKQLRVFNENEGVSVVGGWIEEFTDTIEVINSMRVVPETNKEIIEFSKFRSPFNHPTVMYKKNDVLKAGNYRSDIRNTQDYYLWIDMLTKGYKGYNIQESLLWMRANSNLFKRRAGKEYLKLQINLLNIMKERKYISNFQYIKSFTLRTLSSLAPNWLRKLMFKKVLRKQVNK